ncbi:DUF2569 family protein [bacterium]|nr:DUF2569 family protein [bacterium]
MPGSSLWIIGWSDGIPLTNWICDRKLTFINFQSFQDAIRNVIYCLIWISYFKKSKRVSLYYNNSNIAID